MNSLPNLGGCGRPATARVEIYSPANGQAHGSLDYTIHTCADHYDAAIAAIVAAGLTAYRMPGDVHDNKFRRCGAGMDFTGVQAEPIVAPEPVDDWPAERERLSAEIAVELARMESLGEPAQAAEADPEPGPEPTITIAVAALRDPIRLVVDLRDALLVHTGQSPLTTNGAVIEQHAAATALLRALGVEAVSE